MAWMHLQKCAVRRQKYLTLNIWREEIQYSRKENKFSTLYVHIPQDIFKKTGYFLLFSVENGNEK